MLDATYRSHAECVLKRLVLLDGLVLVRAELRRGQLDRVTVALGRLAGIVQDSGGPGIARDPCGTRSIQA